MIVKKNIRKRIFIALLTAALLGNSFNLPGGTLTAAEKEPDESAVSDSGAATENTAEENPANEEAEKVDPSAFRTSFYRNQRNRLLFENGGIASRRRFRFEKRCYLSV